MRKTKAQLQEDLDQQKRVTNETASQLVNKKKELDEVKYERNSISRDLDRIRLELAHLQGMVLVYERFVWHTKYTENIMTDPSFPATGSCR